MIVRVLLALVCVLAGLAALTIVLPSVDTGVARATADGDTSLVAVIRVVPIAYVTALLAGIGLIVVLGRNRNSGP